MAPVTTFRGKKPFSWSYSKLKNFEACPKKHWHVDVQKDFAEEDSDQLVYGNRLHAALAARLGDKKTPLPPEFILHEADCERVEIGEGDILVERKYAITREFGPCDYFARNVWYRGIADVLKLRLLAGVAMAGDWKTGKVVEDSVQLALMAQCVFSHHPEIKAVKAVFFWLAHDAETSQVFRREEMPEFWNSIFHRIRELEHAYEHNMFPPKPSGLCKRWCPVRACPHFGEG